MPQNPFLVPTIKGLRCFYHDPDQRVTCKDEHCFLPEISQDEPSLGVELNEYKKNNKQLYIKEKMLLVCGWNISSSVYNLNLDEGCLSYQE